MSRLVLFLTMTGEASPLGDTRSRILEAARRHFSSRPDTAATLGQLARDAGVSRATLHRYFRHRTDLLRAIDVEPEPDTRERVLRVGMELLARDGLAHLSMEEVAERSGISRASLYRLFPGKPALFTALLRTYSPLGPIAATVQELGDRPPEVVMPAVARVIAARLEGRVGLVRALFLEVVGPSSDAAEARDVALVTTVSALLAYIAGQMVAGRLRPMHPVLALQSFAGPLLFHLLTRPLAEAALGFDVPLEAAAVELAGTWVAAMHPVPEEAL